MSVCCVSLLDSLTVFPDGYLRGPMRLVLAIAGRNAASGIAYISEFSYFPVVDSSSLDMGVACDLSAHARQTHVAVGWFGRRSAQVFTAHRNSARCWAETA